MTRFHTVRLANAAPQPWRNGGGTTRELLAWPPVDHPSGDDWTVRVSVASIDRSGDFSPYPGVERWFVVLDGTGVRLALPRGEKTLAPGDAPLHFEGEAAPACHLLEGPTQDLNFMVRRGAGVSSMRPARAGSGVDGPTRWRALYAAGDVLLDIDGITDALHAGTLAWTDEHDAVRWELHERSAGPAWWLVLEA